MRVAIIYNKDFSNVINVFGMQNKEIYNPSVVKRVADALEKGGHNVEIIDGDMHVIDNIRDFFPKVQDGEKFGIVFNMAYGIQGESRYTHIPAMLEMLGIPYVGSSPSGHAIALDKIITKIILQKNNIPTPDFWVFSSVDEDMSDVEFPVIVKPKMESVSFGLRVVYNLEELRDAVGFIIDEFKQQALVEKFIRGREFAVGVIGNSPVEVLPVLEIDLNGDPDAIQTVDDKKFKPKDKICPADIDEELAKKMQDLSLKVFKTLGLRDFSRVDIRLDEENNIHILEVNSMASLGATGSYVTAAKAAGYDFDSLVNKMLDVASFRYFSKENIGIDHKIDGKKIALPIRAKSFLRSRLDQTENLLEGVIDINTYYKNIEGVNRFGNIIKKSFNNLGFSYESFPQTEVGNILFFSNSDDGEYDYLLIGNLDNNVKLKKQKYFMKTEHKIFGTGVWEHKGGIVMMLQSLQSLKYLRMLKKMKIGVLLTTDETVQGRFSRNIIKEKSKKAKYIFGLHGGFPDGGMVTSRSGSASYTCNMNLRENKNSEDVSKAVAVFSKLVSDWTNLSNEEKGIIISPREFKIESNITEPFAHADLELSVRFNDNEMFKVYDEKIRKIVPANKYKKFIDFHLEGGQKRPALTATEKSDEIMSIIKNIADNFDIRINGEHRWSSADISNVESGKYVIDGFGPSGKKEYIGNEYILKHNLLEKSLLLATTLMELEKI
ncbi:MULTISPECIES: M20/M25/M40 family metallo-hydrolase [Psychrilyobacter]|uniref:M20/M25/M40 family metallo-hydrolase n=1 Tax=Psychrilyobacter piezotolerans TaxID=2293438 RepID=A0ABX9KG12_9FUSO|nr:MULTISPECIES: M20/M25/M40 family metallo-hydrolase [Psychrilyobacter]MCS5420956.1 M20/M25/M40 family metallo-hydrolase [Psychrilyobacter sp. S5]NDI78294.1 M20/M25/M40 family metallo-hydrolase [Psychrilyobacter piezotolerans]RDE60856.1 M20/M25/M40 family metallo-hydrolase [Psychrilyobacter sp. S5]REI40645.1 M20/M25/M40 family metallo-hydrolase [Psychrilyobacter piezotolerans]